VHASSNQLVRLGRWEIPDYRAEADAGGRAADSSDIEAAQKLIRKIGRPGNKPGFDASVELGCRMRATLLPEKVSAFKRKTRGCFTNGICVRAPFQSFRKERAL
jgi:hypothetical protein